MKRANDWLSSEPEARDFGALYLENLDAMNAAVEAQLVEHAAFGPMVARASPEQRARRSDTRARVEKALAGAYAERLAEDGTVFPSLGLELADWYEMGTHWSRWFVPRLVERFHGEPARLAAAIVAMQSFLHAGLERFRAEPRWSAIPVVAWTVKDLGADETRELAEHAEAVLPENGSGARLLLDHLQKQLRHARRQPESAS